MESTIITLLSLAFFFILTHYMVVRFSGDFPKNLNGIKPWNHTILQLAYLLSRILIALFALSKFFNILIVNTTKIFMNNEILLECIMLLGTFVIMVILLIVGTLAINAVKDGKDPKERVSDL